MRDIGPLIGMKEETKKVQNCVRRGQPQLHVLLAVVYLYMCHVAFAPYPLLIRPHPRPKLQVPPNRLPALYLAALLGLPGTVHVRDLGDELGGEDVDLLVGAVQQAQCPDLVGGGRIVSGGFGFLAAVSGLESCDFGGLRVKGS
jgi:hypothetical protein